MKIRQNSDIPPELVQLNLQQRIAVLGKLIAEYQQQEIERDEQPAAERARRRIAEALYQAGLILNSNLNYEAVLDAILEQARQLVPHEAASLMLVEGNLAWMFRWCGYDQFIAKGEVVPPSFDISDTPTLRTMQDIARPLVLPSVETDPPWIAKSKQNWIKSYLGAPICVRGRVLGFIKLHDDLTIVGL